MLLVYVKLLLLPLISSGFCPITLSRTAPITSVSRREIFPGDNWRAFKACKVTSVGCNLCTITMYVSELVILSRDGCMHEFQLYVNNADWTSRNETVMRNHDGKSPFCVVNYRLFSLPSNFTFSYHTLDNTRIFIPIADAFYIFHLNVFENAPVIVPVSIYPFPTSDNAYISLDFSQPKSPEQPYFVMLGGKMNGSIVASTIEWETIDRDCALTVYSGTTIDTNQEPWLTMNSCEISQRSNVRWPATIQQLTFRVSSGRCAFWMTIMTANSDDSFPRADHQFFAQMTPNPACVPTTEMSSQKLEKVC
ncbi:unnamed protein product, partial [Mesorhabditis belari]|uniref:Uncharacterized protein n=1 Tax=Mesorhabditis belari TaxID=2138241 RepID=A0AAF3J6M6_9BILA